MKLFAVTIVVIGCVYSVPAHAAFARPGKNLCFNGSFDNTNNALEGWNYDYRWLGNANYMDNHNRVSVVPSEARKKTVLRYKGGTQGKVESKPIPFELGYRYKCTLDMKGSAVRMYFAGYKWQPGVRPHLDPHLGKLRKIYKSKPWVGAAGNRWQTVSFEFPLKNLSDLAMQSLKYVRFVTVYLLCDIGGEVFWNNVRVTRTKLSRSTSRLKNTRLKK